MEQAEQAAIASHRNAQIGGKGAVSPAGAAMMNSYLVNGIDPAGNPIDPQQTTQVGQSVADGYFPVSGVSQLSNSFDNFGQPVNMSMIPKTQLVANNPKLRAYVDSAQPGYQSMTEELGDEESFNGFHEYPEYALSGSDYNAKYHQGTLDALGPAGDSTNAYTAALAQSDPMFKADLNAAAKNGGVVPPPPKSQFHPDNWTADGVKAGVAALQGAGNLYLGHKTYGLAKDQFKHAKKMDAQNLAMSKKSYNNQLEAQSAKRYGQGSAGYTQALNTQSL